MKQATHHGHTVTAGPDAPKYAICPECDMSVVLKRYNSGNWIYCHAQKSTAWLQNDCPSCQPKQASSSLDDPDYAITLAIIRRTILDALDGYGLDELDCLFSPLSQAGLQRLLNADEETTKQATERTIDRLKAMPPDLREAVYHALNWGSIDRLQMLCNASE